MRAALGLIGILLAASVPAMAQDNGYGYEFHEGGNPFSGIHTFAGLRGSIAFSGTVSTTVPTAPPTTLRASYNTGAGASVYIGTALPIGFKVELEGVYRNLPFNQTALNGTASVAHGQANIGGPMVNLIWDLPVGDFVIQPFIGGGIGGAYTAATLRDPTNANTYLTTRKWGLAYDALGGLAMPLSQTSRFTAMYRWMRVDGLDSACGTSGPATLTCSTNLDSESVDLGLEMDL